MSSDNEMNSGIFAGSRIASKNAEEVNTLIFLNDSYNSKQSLIGDISNWSYLFKSFETYTIGYFDLFGNKFGSVLRYIFSADEYEKVKAVILSLSGVIVVGLIVYILAIFNLFGF